jgi:peroxiredoxin
MLNIRTRQLTVSFAFVLSALISLGGCGKSSPLSANHSLPEFELTLLDGSKFNQIDLKGQVAIINFWATTCAICVKEMPEFIKTYQQYGPRGLNFIAIAMSYDPPMYVVDFSNKRNLPFKVAMDSDKSASKAFGGIEATPTSFLVNKQGKIIKKYVGEPNWVELNSLIENALAEKPVN